MPFEPGQKIAHFEVIRKIGEGGMGEVYLAEDQKLHRQVGLKVLSAQFLDDSARAERFIREARMAAKISHSNVMAIYDMDVAKDEESGQEFSFIVLEYIEGDTLTDHLQNRSLSIAELLRISEKTALGLAAAHKLSIVHRDIKSENIKIDEAGDPKILDFGLAKPIDFVSLGGKSEDADTISRELTQDGKILGTVTYMSPEQARGEAVDTRSDVFSFGILLYRMFTGEFPFEGPDKVSVLARILEKKQEPLRRKNEAVPAELERIVDKCLQKDPENRYQDTRDLVVDLRNLRRQFESEISDTSSVYQGISTAKRKGSRIKRYLLSVSALAIIVLLLLIFRPWRLEVAPTDEAVAQGNRLAVMYFENLTDPEDSRQLGKIVSNLLITDLTESQYVEVVSSQRLYDILKLIGEEDTRVINQDVASEVAQKAQAKWMLLGSILQVEPNIVFTVQLVDVAGGNTIASQRITGAPDQDIFSLVDQLTVKIKSDLALPAAAMEESDPQVAGVTTQSAEAYRHYLAGIDYSHRLLWHQAAESYRRAIDLDSTFAMAYYRLSLSSGGVVVSRKKAINKAVQYLDRANTIEQQYILAQHALYHDSNDVAIRRLKFITENYPDEKEAWYRLGDLYDAHSEDIPLAVEMYLKAVEIDPLFKYAYNALAYRYHDLGEFEKSIWAINQYIAIAPDEANPYDTRGDLYAFNGQVDQALASYTQAYEKNPDFYPSLTKKGHMHLVRHEYAQAESCYQQLSAHQEKNVRSWGRAALAMIPTYRGQFDKALEILDAGIAADKMEQAEGGEHAYKYSLKAAIYYERKNFDSALSELDRCIKIHQKFSSNLAIYSQVSSVFVLAESGRIADAEAAAESLKANIEQKKLEVMFAYWFARGGIEMARENPDTAICYFEKGAETVPDMNFEVRYHLADAYLEAGRLGEAVSQLEKALERYDEDRINSTVWAVKAYYLLGQAYEKSGWTNKAIEQYGKFLDIWKDADAGIASVEDAKTRLANLKKAS